MYVDGIEYALLRRTAGVAFGLELMYRWANKTAVGGIQWFTFFRDTLHNCLQLGVEDKRAYLTKYLKVFKEATFDFIQLQRINYRASFQCIHSMRCAKHVC